MWQLLVVLTLLLTVYYLQRERHRKKYAKFYNLPGPMRLPFIGHGYLFLRKKIFKVFEEIIKNVETPCLLYLPEPYYCTSDPEDIKILLNHPNVMSKSDIYSFFQVAFGNGLIFAQGDIWRPNRKLLSRSFNRRLLNSFVPIFYKNSCNLNDHLSECENLYGLFESYSLTNFFETSGGISLNINERVVNMLTKGQEILMKRATSLTLRYDFIYRWTKEAKVVSSFVEEFHTTYLDILKKKSNQEIDASLTKLSFFDLLLTLKKQKKYNDEQMFQEFCTFGAAATDTTGYTLAFVCVLLGMNPHIQEKVFEEVMTVVGPDKEIEYTDLPNLNYTEMVIWETMRILPVVPLIGRKAEADIDIGHCVIPSGTNILIGLFELHRKEKYYPNPLEFNPNRFLPEEIKKRDPNTYIPFSIGSRNCIGWIYALMMMKLTVANTVRTYKISSKHKSVTEFNIESNITMKIVPQPDCCFTRR